MTLKPNANDLVSKQRLAPRPNIRDYGPMSAYITFPGYGAALLCAECAEFRRAIGRDVGSRDVDHCGDVVVVSAGRRAAGVAPRRYAAQPALQRRHTETPRDDGRRRQRPQ